ncbi:peptide/nickel transport system substrate-binding protein [Stella humosa]|uniref:Peptide/nickel transport system substrate-binding protein n=1 Tax=Stella humosa TaxID=94 RepID=A0A3N1LHC5_9PROT|nr:ABC transporter substrate-binding protein [Stella humosa]ROP90917.1 peptide/nickel transport system substrate-binding protein [Stella humosa]BBK34733.1 ABC transporter substrate-binding protein [Stella humosa]
MGFARRILFVAAGALAAATASMPAEAQKSKDELRVIWRNVIANVDPYFNGLRDGVVFAHHVWDHLIERDPDTFEYKPGLATEWKWVDDVTLDLTLRQGVKFHDGSAFGAEDVVHTLNYVSDPANKALYQRNTNWIKKAEKVDGHKVRIHLHRPFPPALEFLSLPVFIFSRNYTGPEEQNRRPMGTGPYRVASIEGGKEYRFERFADHYEGSPKGKAKIGKVQVRIITDAATELAELLAGRADLLWYVDADQLPNIQRQRNLKTVSAETMRIGFLSLDAAGRTGADNPLTKQKVRQAIIHSIDRKSFVDNLVQGEARVIHAPCFPTQLGCDDSGVPKYAYDPKKAKALLAEAGYPNGFKTQLMAFRSRTWTEALQQDLKAVGIDAEVQMLPVATLIQRFQKGETPIYQGDWGSFSINDASAIISSFFKGTEDDYARDEQVKAWLDTADNSNDVAVRKENYKKAVNRIMEQAYWVPLHTFVTNYAHTAEVDFRAYKDEIPRYWVYSWK